MVFIRPRIINNAEESRDATERKYQLVRNEQRRWTDDGKRPSDLDFMLEEVIGTASPTEIDLKTGEPPAEDAADGAL